MREYELMELVDIMEGEDYLRAYALYTLLGEKIQAAKDISDITDAYEKLLTEFFANLDVGKMAAEKYGENSAAWIHIHGNALLCLSLAGMCAEKMLDEMDWQRREVEINGGDDAT